MLRRRAVLSSPPLGSSLAGLPGVGGQGRVVLLEPGTVDHRFVNTLPASGLSPFWKYFGLPRQHAGRPVRL